MPTVKVTWCVSEGQSIDDRLALHSEEKSTPIWTPTTRLTKTDNNAYKTCCIKEMRHLFKHQT